MTVNSLIQLQVNQITSLYLLARGQCLIECTIKKSSSGQGPVQLEENAGLNTFDVDSNKPDSNPIV